MHSRDRVQRAIHFRCPDRAPISHAVLPAAQQKYGQALNDLLAEYREDFGWDYMADLPPEKFPALYKPGRNADDFGTVWWVEWAGLVQRREFLRRQVGHVVPTEVLAVFGQQVI